MQDSGVAVIDKPKGCTSHDVVSRVRRALQTRKVGHCGTLDPMATGVLLVAVGEGTKLVPYLTAASKAYDATLMLGAGTDSLDADGEVVERAEVPALETNAVENALRSFVGVQMQRAPKVSAIKVDGQRLHARARRGEDFEAPLREVELIEAKLKCIKGAEIHFGVHCGKGFYVRSLGRDLAQALGTVGHLSALRRVSVGDFRLDEAVPLDGLEAARLMSIEEAVARVLPVVELDEAQAIDASHGRRVAGLEGGGQIALFRDQQLLAIAERENESARILRGFNPA